MIVIASQPTECMVEAHYDRQVCRAVAAALAASKYGALRQLNCAVSDGVVEIFGTVSSFYLKQLAQAAAMQLANGRVVRNLVEVCGESPVLIALSCDAVVAGAACAG